MIAAEQAAAVEQIRKYVFRRCATVGPRFGDVRKDVLAEVLKVVAPILGAPPGHLTGRGWPATEDERGYLDAELEEMVDAWRSRVRVYAGGTARNLIAGIVKKLKGPHPDDPRCLVAYVDDAGDDDEHALEGAGASAGVCPGSGHRESRFAAASWASSNEDEQIEHLDLRRQLAAGVEPGPDHDRFVLIKMEVAPSSFAGVTLTADFDREELWDRVRAFASRYVPEGAPSRAARARILGMRSCPPVAELRMTSTTLPRAVVDHYRGQETSRSYRKRERPSPVASPSAALMQAGDTES